MRYIVIVVTVSFLIFWLIKAAEHATWRCEMSRVWISGALGGKKYEVQYYDPWSCYHCHLKQRWLVEGI